MRSGGTPGRCHGSPLLARIGPTSPRQTAVGRAGLLRRREGVLRGPATYRGEDSGRANSHRTEATQPGAGLARHSQLDGRGPAAMRSFGAPLRRPQRLLGTGPGPRSARLVPPPRRQKRQAHLRLARGCQRLCTLALPRPPALARVRARLYLLRAALGPLGRRRARSPRPRDARPSPGPLRRPEGQRHLARLGRRPTHGGH
jgi:hypothetical protein